MISRISRLAAIAVLAVTAPLFADKMKHDGFNFNEITVVGLRNGELVVQQSGQERRYAIDKLESLEVDKNAKFSEAERLRGEPKKALAAYQAALQNTTGAMRSLIQARMIAMQEADGRWTDAVKTFVELYKAGPAASLWAIRPTKLPDASSKMLVEAADWISTQLAAFKQPEAIKNLKMMQLEMYTKAGNDKAGPLAKELGTGGTVDKVNPPENTNTNTAVTPTTPVTPTVSSTSSEDIRAVEGMIAAKKFDDAIGKIDAALASATGESAVKLYQLRAQASVGLSKPADAAVSLLRIATHYPTSASAPSALLQAGELQKSLKNDDAAKRLFKEVVDKYPASREAAAAKKHL